MPITLRSVFMMAAPALAALLGLVWFTSRKKDNKADDRKPPDKAEEEVAKVEKPTAEVEQTIVASKVQQSHTAPVLSNLPPESPGDMAGGGDNTANTLGKDTATHSLCTPDSQGRGDAETSAIVVGDKNDQKDIEGECVANLGAVNPQEINTLNNNTGTISSKEEALNGVNWSQSEVMQHERQEKQVVANHVSGSEAQCHMNDLRTVGGNAGKICKSEASETMLPSVTSRTADIKVSPVDTKPAPCMEVKDSEPIVNGQPTLEALTLSGDDVKPLGGAVKVDVQDEPQDSSESQDGTSDSELDPVSETHITQCSDKSETDIAPCSDKCEAPIAASPVEADTHRALNTDEAETHCALNTDEAETHITLSTDRAETQSSDTDNAETQSSATSPAIRDETATDAPNSGGCAREESSCSLEAEVSKVTASSGPVIPGVTIESPVSESNSDHSEMSGDSGKGQSIGEVAAAGPTENSGELASYEFNFPTQLCGLLIGKHGKHINVIKEKSGARISVKRIPFREELQAVYFEGTREQVDRALALIKQRFPTSRFPDLDFTDTRPSNSTSGPVLQPEMMQLHLPEGVSVDVIVSSVVQPNHLFIQQPTHPTFPMLERMNQCMNMCYQQEGVVPQLPRPIEVGVICAAPMYNGWYRAQVVMFHEESDECDIRFVDYGGYMRIQGCLLRQIRSDFTTLPFQGVECYLANVIAPKGGETFPEEAGAVLESLVQGKLLQAEVVAHEEDGVPYIQMYEMQGDQMLLMNRELVDRGLAQWLEQF